MGITPPNDDSKPFGLPCSFCGVHVPLDDIPDAVLLRVKRASTSGEPGHFFCDPCDKVAEIFESEEAKQIRARHAEAAEDEIVVALREYMHLHRPSVLPRKQGIGPDHINAPNVSS